MRVKVLNANNGKEAFEVVKKKNPELVLLEINKSIPIIIITAYGTMKSVRETLREGAYDYYRQGENNTCG